jgi:formylmethanofuran dehydrogenase subunit C
MLTLRLEYGDSVPLEAPAIRPDQFAIQSLAEIQQIPIWKGSIKVPLAELVKVFGDPSAGLITLEGDWSRVRRLGEEMTAGSLKVRGPVGMHLGARMKGGQIEVDGDASDWVGAEMRGGLIRIRGNAGNLLGAGYRGVRSGMRGGTILVGKNAGNEVGSLMRRGVISVLGKTGDHAGTGMIAGTLALWGGCGIRPGAGMRRGSIICGKRPDSLLPSFSREIPVIPAWLALLAGYIRGLGQDLSRVKHLARDPYLPDPSWNLCRGDLLGIGMGEILWPRD